MGNPIDDRLFSFSVGKWDTGGVLRLPRSPVDVWSLRICGIRRGFVRLQSMSVHRSLNVQSLVQKKISSQNEGGFKSRIATDGLRNTTEWRSNL